MPAGISQFHTRFNAVGNIVVVGISRLVGQIQGIQRQDVLVLNIPLGGNINASVLQGQISEGIGRTHNFCICQERNAAFHIACNKWDGFLR